MQIVVLGSNSMLGHYVYKYFKNSIGFPTMDFDVLKMTKDELREKLKIFEPIETCIVNCIDIDKLKINEVKTEDAIYINAVFPHILSNICKELNLYLIGTTTEHVYSGKHVEPYVESDWTDSGDFYGRTKSLGETDECTLIRTSVIGEELGTQRFLIESMKNNKNDKIDGFLNCQYNGITCLEFAKCIERIIKKDLFWKGVIHIYSSPVCEYHLLKMINDTYELNIQIRPTYSDDPYSRILGSEYDVCSFLKIPSLEKQIKEMKQFNVCAL